MINIKDAKNKEIQKLANYSFIKTIGKGTFGKVKLGIHIPTNEKVAIKILEKSKIQSKKDLERIQNEIKYLKLFNHPNIVKIYEIVEDDANFYIIMEYVSGGELFSYIVKNKKLDEQETSFFYSQIIHIIKEIHRFKICHRDIKPENLLLTSNKTLKIIDFGLSNEYKDYLNTPCGSPCYASPEIISGDPYKGIEIDLWASGIILYSMLCGYLPFDDKDNEILFSKILQCKVIFPKKNKLSDEAKDLITKILQPEPEKRISLDEILNHPFLIYGNKRYREKVNTGIFKQDELIINYMINEMKISNEIELRKSILNNKHNSYTTTFNLLKKKYIEGRLNYFYTKNNTPMNFYIVNTEQKKDALHSNRSIKNTLLSNRYKEIENKKIKNNSVVKDIGNVIQQKFNQNNNNIIIINNADSSIRQPIKMNSLIHSLFSQTTNSNIINNNQNLLSSSVNQRDHLRRLNKKINTSISVEKSTKEKLRGFNTSRISTKLVKNSPNGIIQLNSPVTSGFRLNAKIKGKYAKPKKYLNMSLGNDSVIYTNNTINISNNFPINENHILEPKSKIRRRLGTSVNDGWEINFRHKNFNCPKEYKKKIMSGIYVKSIINFDHSKKKINRSLRNSIEKNNNSIKNIDAILNESVSKINNSYYYTSNNTNNDEVVFNRKFNYNNNDTIVNSEIGDINKDHFRKYKYITLSNVNKISTKNIYDQSKIPQKNYLKTSPNLKDYEENANIFNKTVQTISEKDEKIKVNKNKELPFYIRDKLPLNLDYIGNNSARTNKNITSQKKTVYINKKITKPTNHPKKESNLPKKHNSEYLLASVKLTNLKIREIIRRFCREEGLMFTKDEIKFTIFLDKLKKHSFIAEIKINNNDNNREIKLIHNSGDELRTKQFMKKLLFAVVK